MSIVELREQRRYERMREKVLQWCKDYYRPYHGSTAHRADADGNQMIEKKKSGGHMPLNAAVMALWEEGKLKDSRDLFGHELYWLAMNRPAVYGEMHDLFFSYGSGDSDYDELRKQAVFFGSQSRSAEKLRAVDEGIDLITRRLIEAGITDRDFWADFGLNAVPGKQATSTEEEKRKRWLAFERHRERLRLEGYKQYTNKALKAAADECGVDKRTVERAVQEYESGYLQAS